MVIVDIYHLKENFKSLSMVLVPGPYDIQNLSYKHFSDTSNSQTDTNI